MLAALVVAASPTPIVMAAQQPGSAMLVGGVTSQPIGHYDFCKRNRQECRGNGKRTAAPRVTEFGWSVIKEVNESVNFSVLPMTDYEIHGREEVWSYPDVVGDCEDYVLLKRAMLVERGFSVADLLITVVRKPNGEGHAVLTLRTADGDFVLDNLNDTVRVWTETPYTYLKRQASFHPGRWVDIENGDDLMVGSIPD
jgi:predicted transglutaminase-like cysteine proteinase